MSQSMLQVALPMKEAIEVEGNIISSRVHSELAEERFRQVWKPLVDSVGEAKIVEAALCLGIRLTCRLPVADVWVIVFSLGRPDGTYRTPDPDLQAWLKKKMNDRLRVVLGRMGVRGLHYLALSIIARQSTTRVVTHTLRTSEEDLMIGMGFDRMSFLPRSDLERGFMESNLRLVTRKMLDGDAFSYLYDEAFTGAMEHDPGLCAKVMKEEALAHRNRRR